MLAKTLPSTFEPLTAQARAENWAHSKALASDANSRERSDKASLLECAQPGDAFATARGEVSLTAKAGSVLTDKRKLDKLLDDVRKFLVANVEARGAKALLKRCSVPTKVGKASVAVKLS